jgi:hypothetical protein
MRPLTDMVRSRMTSRTPSHYSKEAGVITGGVVAIEQGRSDDLDVFLCEEAIGVADLANLVEEGLDRAIGHSRAIALAILKPALSPCIPAPRSAPNEALFLSLGGLLCGALHDLVALRLLLVALLTWRAAALTE